MMAWTLDDLPPAYREQALDKMRDDPAFKRAELSMSEKEWQTRVTGIFRRHGWLAYHTWNSRKSARGFPDLVAVRVSTEQRAALEDAAELASVDRYVAFLASAPATGAEVLVAELKRVGGVVSPPQRAWLAALRMAGLPVFVWNPTHEPDVRAIAKQGPSQSGP